LATSASECGLAEHLLGRLGLSRQPQTASASSWWAGHGPPMRPSASVWAKSTFIRCQQRLTRREVTASSARRPGRSTCHHPQGVTARGLAGISIQHRPGWLLRVRVTSGAFWPGKSLSGWVGYKRFSPHATGEVSTSTRDQADWSAFLSCAREDTAWGVRAETRAGGGRIGTTRAAKHPTTARTRRWRNPAVRGGAAELGHAPLPLQRCASSPGSSAATGPRPRWIRGGSRPCDDSRLPLVGGPRGKASMAAQPPARSPVGSCSRNLGRACRLRWKRARSRAGQLPPHISITLKQKGVFVVSSRGGKVLMSSSGAKVDARKRRGGGPGGPAENSAPRGAPSASNGHGRDCGLGAACCLRGVRLRAPPEADTASAASPTAETLAVLRGSTASLARAGRSPLAPGTRSRTRRQGSARGGTSGVAQGRFRASRCLAGAPSGAEFSAGPSRATSPTLPRATSPPRRHEHLAALLETYEDARLLFEAKGWD